MINFIDGRQTLPRHKSKTFRTRVVEDIKGICVHQTAGGDDPVATAEYHVGPNHISDTGAPGILYSLFVQKDGTIWHCHNLDVRTWSQGTKALPGDENADYLAIVCGGNFRSPGHKGSEPTFAQILSLLLLIAHLTGEHATGELPGALFGAVEHLSSADLFGHFDFGKAGCPGATLEAIIRAARVHADEGDLDSVRDWQDALLRWDSGCLPKYGPDGDWGAESKAALVAFQQKVTGLEVTGLRDEATERALLMVSR